MGWQAGLLMVGVIFVALIGISLKLAKYRNPVIRYRDINQPGAFMVGKDVKK
jgi:hypothetical protein